MGTIIKHNDSITQPRNPYDVRKLNANASQKTACGRATRFQHCGELHARITVNTVSNQWWVYAQQRAKGATQKDIAEKSGIDQTVLSRWQTGKNPPSAQKVVQFARALGRPPVEALIASGYLTADEAAEVVEIQRGPDALTDDELLAEVRRRMKGAPRGDGERRTDDSADEDLLTHHDEGWETSAN